MYRAGLCGHVDVSLPHTEYGLATYCIVAPAEASANLARYDGIRFGHAVRDGDVLANYLATRGSGFGAEVKRRIMLGTYACPPATTMPTTSRPRRCVR